MTRLLLCHTDDRVGIRLRSASGKSTLCPPGETIEVASSFAGPKAFTGLHVGYDPRVGVVSHDGMTKLGQVPGRWRVIEIQIDDEPCEAAVGAIEAEMLCHPDAIAYDVGGDFGVGSRVKMRATNIGDAPAYFYATWELEDLQ